jgi:hypothetical protein
MVRFSQCFKGETVVSEIILSKASHAKPRDPSRYIPGGRVPKTFLRSTRPPKIKTKKNKKENKREKNTRFLPRMHSL